MRVVAGGATLVVLLLPVCASAADKARATLEYERSDAGASACPDDPTFRSLVAARLGYDPFVHAGEPGSDLGLSVKFRQQGSELTARVRLSSQGSGRRGERTLRSAGSDCSELSATVSLAVALALDPEAVRSLAQPTEPGEPEKAHSPPPSPRSASPVLQKDQPTPHPRAEGAGVEVDVRLEVGVAVGVGLVPSAAVGLRGGAALDVGGWSVGVEGTALLPGSESAHFGEVSASVAYASLVPCARPSAANVFLSLCAVGSLGATSSQAQNVSRSFPTTDVYAAMGPRVGVTLMPAPTVGISAALDLPVALSRVHLLIEDEGREREAWASPPVGFLGGVSAVFCIR